MDQLEDGFYAVINGKPYGPWPIKYTKPGEQSEEKRAADSEAHRKSVDAFLSHVFGFPVEVDLGGVEAPTPYQPGDFAKE